MRFYIICVATIWAALVLAQDQKYSTKYDHVDLTAILQNERSLRSYFKCLLDDGPCSPDGKFLKDTLPDALATSCDKCTPFQRKLVKIASRFVIDNFPDQWERLVKKYDPKNQYQESFAAFLKTPEV